VVDGGGEDSRQGVRFRVKHGRCEEVRARLEVEIQPELAALLRLKVEGPQTKPVAFHALHACDFRSQSSVETPP
jgi:hypothetical protein